MPASGLERYEWVALTTLARVKAKLDPSSQDDGQDAVLTQLIDEVSAQFAAYLQVHTLQKTRDEVHRLRPKTRIVTLDARPIIGDAMVFHGATQTAAANGTTPLDASCYFVRDQSGWIELTPPMTAATYFLVQYTGGLGTDAASAAANAPDIADAADLQVAYRYKRQGNPGGNVTSLAGGGTQYDSQYGLLKEVKRVLAPYARNWL